MTRKPTPEEEACLIEQGWKPPLRTVEDLVRSVKRPGDLYGGEGRLSEKHQLADGSHVQASKPAFSRDHNTAILVHHQPTSVPGLTRSVTYYFREDNQ